MISYADPIGAAAHGYMADEGQTLSVPAAAGVLSGASAPAGDAVSASVVSAAAHGLLTINGDGSFSYTPDAGYAGGDSFSYGAADSAGDSATATVTLTVRRATDGDDLKARRRRYLRGRAVGTDGVLLRRGAGRDRARVLR